MGGLDITQQEYQSKSLWQPWQGDGTSPLVVMVQMGVILHSDGSFSVEFIEVYGRCFSPTCAWKIATTLITQVRRILA